MKKNNPDELFVVVDRNDHVLGYETRKKCHTNKNLIHRGIGIVVFKSDKSVVIQKRSKYKDLYPGYFAISASGHVEKGETYLQAAKRELDEELGIKGTLQKVGKIMHSNEFEREINTVYTLTHDGPFYLNKDEIEKLLIMSRQDIIKNIKKFTPLARKCLELIQIVE